MIMMGIAMPMANPSSQLVNIVALPAFLVVQKIIVSPFAVLVHRTRNTERLPAFACAIFKNTVHAVANFLIPFR